MDNNDLKLMQIRDFGEVMNASFQFLKNERKVLGRLLLYYFVPFLLISSALQSYAQSQIMGFLGNANPENMIESYTAMFSNPFVILNYFFSILVITMLLGILYSYIQVYLEKGPENFTISDIKPLLLKNLLKTLATSIVIGIIVLLGLVMCFLPGIFLANSLSLVIIAYIIEQKGFKAAISRSWNLVWTKWWHTLLINIIGLIIVVMISYILSLPLTIATVTNTMLSVKSGSAVDLPVWYFITQGIISLCTTVLYIIPYTFVAFQYFNLVESEERPSLLEKINELEKENE